MCDLCRISIITTLNDHRIYVERLDAPDSLQCAAEGEAPGPLARLVGRYIRKHECLTCALYLKLQPDLPRKRRRETANALVWLVRQIFR